MTCAEARHLLLEADLAVLRGEGDTELARHVAACDRCARVARHLLSNQGALDAALDALADPARRAARRHTLRPAAWGLAAAAAAVTLLVLLPRPEPDPVPRDLAQAVAPGRVEVDVSAGGRSAVVFQTPDPTITVVWFFQEPERRF